MDLAVGDVQAPSNLLEERHRATCTLGGGNRRGGEDDVNEGRVTAHCGTEGRGECGGKSGPVCKQIAVVKHCYLLYKIVLYV